MKTKSLLSIILFVCSFQSSLCQDTIVEGIYETSYSLNRKGEIHGAFYQYNMESGQEISGFYKNGKRTGEWNYLDSMDFNNSIQCKYKNNLLHGTFYKHDGFDYILKESFRKGIKQGKAVYAYSSKEDSHGTIKCSGKYKKGLKSNRWHFYSQNHENLINVFDYYNLFDANDLTERTTIKYKKGQKHGFCKSELGNTLGDIFIGDKEANYFTSKQQICQGQYKNNLKNGAWLFYAFKNEDSYEDYHDSYAVSQVTFLNDTILGSWNFKKSISNNPFFINTQLINKDYVIKLTEVANTYKLGKLSDLNNKSNWNEYDSKGDLIVIDQNGFEVEKYKLVINDLELERVVFANKIENENIVALTLVKEAMNSLFNEEIGIQFWLVEIDSKRLIAKHEIEFPSEKICNVTVYDKNEVRIDDCELGISTTLNFNTKENVVNFFNVDSNNAKENIDEVLALFNVESLTDINVNRSNWSKIKLQSQFEKRFGIELKNNDSYELNLEDITLRKTAEYFDFQSLFNSKNELEQSGLYYGFDSDLRYRQSTTPKKIYHQLLEDTGTDNLFLGKRVYFPYIDSSRSSFFNLYESIKKIQFWNNYFKTKAKRIVNFHMKNSGDMVLYTNDGYYYSTKGLHNDLYFEKGNKLFPLAQFDLKYNRPDIILKRLGYASDLSIQSFKKAYEKRLEKMGFKEEMLKADFHLPKSNLLNRESINSTNESGFTNLKLNFSDSKYLLDRINVWVNNVPIYGINGVSIRSKMTQDFDTSIQLELNEGANKIEVSVLNQAGAESYKETVRINSKKPAPKSKLYFVGVGVKEFEDATMNLSYSDKDIRDVANLYASNQNFNEIYIDTFLNRSVTKDIIPQIKERLATTTIHDQVVIMYSGHGVLDENLDYFLSTYNIDFDNPKKNGLPYDKLDGLLDGIPARKKLVLIDACHSGEVDKDETIIDSTFAAGVTENETGKGDLFKKIKSNGNSFEMMKELFTDLRRGTGATVISSSAGKYYSYEDQEHQNGLYTYALKEGLSGKADANNNREISVSELKEYLYYRVSELSNGKQKPTARQENLEFDFRVW